MEQGEGSADGEGSQELVRRIHDGDRSAFGELYRRFHDPLLLSIRTRLGPALRARVASEDILQSVFCAALDDMRGFEPRGPGSLARYLLTCALNKMRSKATWFGAGKRRGGVRLTESVAAAVPDPLSVPPTYHDTSAFERLERALLQLPEAMREVVLMRRVEGLSNQEAAVALGRSEEATSKLYNRALAQVGLHLGRDPGRDLGANSGSPAVGESDSTGSSP